jgi:hypothetical protein
MRLAIDVFVLWTLASIPAAILFGRFIRFGASS